MKKKKKRKKPVVDKCKRLNTHTLIFISLTTVNVFFPSTNNKTKKNNIKTFRKNKHPELGEEENVINYNTVRLTLYT